MKNVYYVGSGELTFDLIERIINENLKLELAPEAKERIQKCRDYLDKKTAESAEPLYGITTGFGSLCSKSISPDELGTLQENLIKSHACSVGEEIRPVIIKLMMLLKAHALSLGHSGVQVITVQRILDFFNNDVMPIVYDRGSLGASGDLAPLANLFLPLIGVGDVYYKGRKREAISVLDEFGWEPVKLMSKEGLALLNGTQFMSANGVFAILKAFRLSKKADLIAAFRFVGKVMPAEVMDIRSFGMGYLSQCPLPHHVQGRQGKSIITTVLQHHAVPACLLGGIHQTPAVRHAHGGRHLKSGMASLLHGIYRNIGMCQPIGTNINQVNIRTSAQLPPSAVFAIGNSRRAVETVEQCSGTLYIPGAQIT